MQSPGITRQRQFVKKDLRERSTRDTGHVPLLTQNWFSPRTYIMFTPHTNTNMSHPPSFLTPFVLPRAQICVVSLHNSHYGGVRFGAEASEWLSCLSGSLPNQLYCSSPKAVLFQAGTFACTPLVVPATVQQQPVSYSNRRSLVGETIIFDQLS